MSIAIQIKGNECIYKNMILTFWIKKQLKKLIEKYVRKRFIFSKVPGSKNEIIHIYFSKFLLKV